MQWGKIRLRGDLVKVLAENYWENSRVGNIEIYLLDPASSSLLVVLLAKHMLAFDGALNRIKRCPKKL